MNLYTEKKITDTENRFVVAQGDGREWEGLGTWSQRMQTISHGIDLQ